MTTRGLFLNPSGVEGPGLFDPELSVLLEDLLESGVGVFRNFSNRRVPGAAKGFVSLEG